MGSRSPASPYFCPNLHPYKKLRLMIDTALLQHAVKGILCHVVCVKSTEYYVFTDSCRTIHLIFPALIPRTVSPQKNNARNFHTSTCLYL